MSREASSSRNAVVVRNAHHTRNQQQEEAKENEFEISLNPLHFPPPRTPLNSIPDPLQLHKEAAASDAYRAAAVRSSDKSAAPTHATPRASSRLGKAHSEPNSAQSSPARTVSRASLGVKGKEVSGRVSRGISAANFDFSVEVPHFELREDPSFWSDHNVQVLIRSRPLSNMERLSQGHGRCLRQESAQTLSWLGHPETRFTFDHIACETISQEKLFKVAGLPMVENCMSGYNSCMFAYGQTGSGKTYTMMGEIYQVEGKLSEDCGITPRIFDYLFSRIKMEEECRKDEKLKFNCKCSFLEIYNEQITDLLEPSSTNLQLREDLSKGVYVDNLTEYNVRTVNDVVKLLLQGAANRKIAATHMNSESSRSHSVFTCIIESWWEKDSLSHRRFARLNLVDLAGSERQKSSGAEGDRLKEAANINKSLSTLGLVIMSLVDLAHGKHRHVPYRDSRLTFLLQDSLGGNSKTTIIANVSPSMCSSHETLSTLKFAQRAKLIQNNAKVNEDASGDVGALQRQIQQLKDQLSILMKYHNRSRSPSNRVPLFEESRFADCSGISNFTHDRTETDIPSSVENKKMKCMEAILVGSLRREKMMETAVRKLEAEIENLNQFARQSEEDVQHTNMMLRFREEKIRRLELLVNGSLPADHYLMEENKSLKEEIQLLQARIGQNPELTRSAQENMRLLEQHQLFQNFYAQGERETLLAEISDLRDQLTEKIEQKLNFPLSYDNQDNGISKELEACKNKNSRLLREVDELRGILGKYLDIDQAAFDNVADSHTKDPEDIGYADKYSLVEAMSIRSDSEHEMASFTHLDGMVLKNKRDQNNSAALAVQSVDTQKELMDARSLIEALESEQVYLIEELQRMQEQNHMYMEILGLKDGMERKFLPQSWSGCPILQIQEMQNAVSVVDSSEYIKNKVLQSKLDKLSKDLEEARLLNGQYQEDRATQLSQQHQVESICEQVEVETARTILHLQEEVTALQLELNDRLCCMTQENMKLRNTIQAKEEDLKSLCGQWEKATLELTSFLVEGSKSLKDASHQIESIVCTFPQDKVCINEHVERAARAFIEKEETISQLEKSLEDAQQMVVDMELKINSLKEATIAFNAFPLPDNDKSTEEAIHLSTMLNEKINMVEMLETKLKSKEDHINEAEKRANAAIVVIKWLYDCHKVGQRNDTEGHILISKLESPNGMGSCAFGEAGNAPIVEIIQAQVELESLILESENFVSAFYKDLEVHIGDLQMEIVEDYTTNMELVKDLAKEINEMRNKFMALKGNCQGFQYSTVNHQTLEPLKLLEFENQPCFLHRVTDELAKLNGQLKSIEDSIYTNLSADGSMMAEEYIVEAHNWSADNSALDSSTSDSDFSTESVGNNLNQHSYTSFAKFSGETIEQMRNVKVLKGSEVESESEELMVLLRKSRLNGAMAFYLRKELDTAFDAFYKLNVHLTTILSGNGLVDCPYPEETKERTPSSGLRMQIAQACPHYTTEVVVNDNHPNVFLSKCEEVRATMKEADYLLNALLGANKNANELNIIWKQANEELVLEKSHLIAEKEQLKSFIDSQEGEYKLQLDELSHGWVEVANSMSFIKGCFQQMQREVEDKYKILYSDVLSMGTELLHFISHSRSLLADICTEVVKRGCACRILYKYFCPIRLEECQMAASTLQTVTREKDVEGDQSQLVNSMEVGELEFSSDEVMYENLSLKKELERKEVLLKGLLFDFSLLQETASNRKDVKDETEKLLLALKEVQHRLEMKTSELNDLLVQHRKAESRLLDTENALLISNSNIEQAKEAIDSLSDQSAELRMLLKEMYLKKSEVEEQLEEQKEIVKGLEEEIIHLNSFVDEKVQMSIEGLEEELTKVSKERDQLCEEICELNDKLEMANALADENEAIAVEARQESEASKLYAEQKEEEVKILEHSVEELECTINVLENKVNEMDGEVERHRMIRNSLEMELQALRQRLLMVENFTDIADSANKNSVQNEDYMSRLVELQEAHSQIRLLEKNIAEKEREIKQCKEYISELVLHSEAQASQYQEKYKTLESMVREVKANLSSSTSAAPALDKNERSSMRTRGSSSPFRCIASLVQQMNVEKDQELSVSRLRIEELEAALANQQKEVCMLNARLAAAESMTHDVIRDLLGVKLDMTNYANLIDQHQVQKLVEEAHEQTAELHAKEQEILNLRKQVNDLIEERESCISEINKKCADILAAQMTVEQFHERDQLLSAQNEMLKMDKTNLLRRVAELDEMVKALLGPQSTQHRIQQTSKTKESGVVKMGEADLTSKLVRSEKLLSRVNDELAEYRKSKGSHPHSKMYGSELNNRRKQKV